MVEPIRCAELRRRIRQYDEQRHREEEVVRQANNEIVRLQRQILEEERRYSILDAADTAAGGLPVGRGALMIVQLLRAGSLDHAKQLQRDLINRLKAQVSNSQRVIDQANRKIDEIQYNSNVSQDALDDLGC